MPLRRLEDGQAKYKEMSNLHGECCLYPLPFEKWLRSWGL